MAQSMTLNDLSQIILSKERDLNQFHNLRCSQLESLVVERDELLLESSRRFEKLKDDFEYNLALIQARDLEIKRLEDQLCAIQRDYSAIKTECNQHILHIEAAHTRESDTLKKIELNKVNNKIILDELREGMERLMLDNDEEVRMKDREVDSLRGEIRRLNAQRDESLESQRRDLTHTFEKILQKSEEMHAARDQDIATNLVSLDERIDKLVTDNSRLKNELVGAARQCEQLTEECSLHKESRRQLQWTLDDERAARAQEVDLATHQLHQLTLELSLHNKNAAKDVTELKRKLAQGQEEAERNKGFCTALKERLEQMRITSQRELAIKKTELARSHKLQSRQQREIQVDRDSALQRATAAKVEAEAADLRLRSLTVHHDSLEQELVQTRERLREVESEASVLQRQHTEGLAKVRSQQEEAAQQRVDDANTLHNAGMLQVQRHLADVSSELEMCRAALQARSAELNEERQESAALKLRFAVHEGQTQLLHRQPVAAPHSSEADPYAQHATRYGDGGIGAVDLPSPMFSEDMGPVSMSFPGSPMNMSVRYHQPPAVFCSGDFTGTDFNAHRARPRKAFDAWSDSIEVKGNTVQRSELDDELKTENDLLKRVIKDMCTEMEKLQSQNTTTNAGHPAHEPSTHGHKYLAARSTDRTASRSDHSDDGSGWSEEGSSTDSSRNSADEEDRQKFGILEAQNQRLVGELVRLRKDRHLVLDVGNKLQAALSEHVSAPTQTSEEEAAEQLAEVEMIRNWLTSAPPPRSHSSHGPSSDEWTAAEEETLRRNHERQRADEERELQQDRDRQRRESDRQNGLTTDALLGNRRHDTKPSRSRNSHSRDRVRDRNSEFNREEHERSDSHHRRHGRDQGRSHSRSRQHSHSRGRSAKYADDHSDVLRHLSDDDDQVRGDVRRVDSRGGGKDGRGRGRVDAEEEETKYTSAGHKVWGGSPSRESALKSALSTAVEGGSVSQGQRPSSVNHKPTTDSAALGRKQQSIAQMQLHGQSLSSTTTAIATLPDAQTLNIAGSGNLLTAVNSALPKNNSSTLTNSSRMTPSQIEAQMRIKIAKSKNDQLGGAKLGVQGVNPQRKVVNYAIKSTCDTFIFK